MIHYHLRCSDEHEFDGWFKDSTSFERQAKRGLLECPVCGDSEIERALMAPSLGRRSNVAVQPAAPRPLPTLPAQSGAAVTKEHLPDHFRAMLQKLRAEVEKNCDHVGNRFAAEARRMHNGEVTPRAIYGDATPEQAEALADDGIEIASIPWVPRADG